MNLEQFASRGLKAQLAVDEIIKPKDLKDCPCCGFPAKLVQSEELKGFGHCECTNDTCQLKTRLSAIPEFLWNERKAEK